MKNIFALLATHLLTNQYVIVYCIEPFRKEQVYKFIGFNSSKMDRRCSYIDLVAKCYIIYVFSEFLSPEACQGFFFLSGDDLIFERL